MYRDIRPGITVGRLKDYLEEYGIGFNEDCSLANQSDGGPGRLEPDERTAGIRNVWLVGEIVRGIENGYLPSGRDLCDYVGLIEEESEKLNVDSFYVRESLHKIGCISCGHRTTREGPSE